MSLLWTVFLSCVVTYFMIVVYGRFTLVTGETALFAFRKHIHPAAGLFFVVALGANMCGSVMGVMGIVADVCHEWSKGFVEGGLSPVLFAALMMGLVYFVFLNGRLVFFQRVMACVVSVMAACFLLNFFLLMPALSEIVKGMVPGMPEVAADAGKGPFLLIASMVGTTVFSGLFILRTTQVKEAGWTLADSHVQRRDAMFATAMMFLVSVSIMAAAAGTLHKAGVELTEASQMIGLLEPLAGRMSVAIFVLGIVAAGLSSQLPNCLLVSWLICDYSGGDRDLRKLHHRVIVFVFALLGLVVPVFDARPVVVMIASQAFGALILPATVLCILYLGNKKALMGEHRNGVGANMALSAVLLFALTMSGVAIRGFFLEYVL